MLGVYHDDPALPTIRSQIYHLSLSSDNISRDIDILSGGIDGISAGGKLILSANDKHRNQWKLKINILKGIIPR